MERNVTGCVTMSMSDWCRRYRRKLHRSRGAILRPGFVQSFSPHTVRGEAERRQALVRIAAPRGPPRGRTDPWIARDHRPMTLAGAPLGAPPRHFWRSFRIAAAPGRASGFHLFLPLTSAPVPLLTVVAPWPPGGQSGLRPASTSQSGHSAARLVARSRPSAGLRGLPAGAAPRSIRRTSPEDAPQRARRAHMSLYWRLRRT
jgi:hypothetical protein